MRHFWDMVAATGTAASNSSSHADSAYGFTYAGDWKVDYSNTSSSAETCSGAYTYVWRDDSWHAESPTSTYGTGNSYYDNFAEMWNRVNTSSWFNYDPIKREWKYVTEESQNMKIDPAQLEELL